MRSLLVGRTPRLTAYFCGIAAGLAFLAVGLEAVRIDALPLSGGALWLYGAVGVLGGAVLAFVAGYLNGSILASWAMGCVPCVGRAGGPLAVGAYGRLPAVVFAGLAAGVVLGTTGFVVAVAKHRRDARTADLPEPLSLLELARLVGVSGLLAAGLFVASRLV